MKKIFLAIFLQIGVALEANRLEPRSGPTNVGPDLGSSLFAIVQNTNRSVSRLKWVNIPEDAFKAFKLVYYSLKVEFQDGNSYSRNWVKCSAKLTFNPYSNSPE